MGSLAWKALGGAATVAATTIAERGVKTAWKAATGDAPPKKPNDPDVSWADAVGWAMLSAGAVAFAKYWATNKAANYYRESSGKYPQDFKPATANKSATTTEAAATDAVGVQST